MFVALILEMYMNFKFLLHPKFAMDALSKIKSFRNNTVKVHKPKAKIKKQSYEGLKDLQPSIKPGLDLIFIGFNPGIESSRSQHHYAHHTNAFWKLFNEAKILEKSLSHQGQGIDPNDKLLKSLLKQCKAENDLQLVKYNIGFSDLVLRCTRAALELSMAEKLQNVPRLLQEFREAKPKKVAIIGKGIWEVFIKYLQDKSPIEYGLQPKSIVERLIDIDIDIYVFPSTSGLVTSMNYQQKLALWHGLYD